MTSLSKYQKARLSTRNLTRNKSHHVPADRILSTHQVISWADDQEHPWENQESHKDSVRRKGCLCWDSPIPGLATAWKDFLSVCPATVQVCLNVLPQDSRTDSLVLSAALKVQGLLEGPLVTWGHTLRGLWYPAALASCLMWSPPIHTPITDTIRQEAFTRVKPMFESPKLQAK